MVSFDHSNGLCMFECPVIDFVASFTLEFCQDLRGKGSPFIIHFMSRDICVLSKNLYEGMSDCADARSSEWNCKEVQ